MSRHPVKKKMRGTPARPRTDTIKHTAGKSLGLSLRGPADAVKSVKRGLPIACAEDLRKSLGVSQQVFGRVTNMSERTIVRRKTAGEGRLKTDESERVLRIGLLFDRAVETFGGVEQARAWLKAPSHALGGKTPLEFADTEPGAREVENLLGRIEQGVFS
ncbi:MAG TPA: DUF2384 domain-containing protein [Candidatus Hydrogenedentes bacterium]|nr:DUF2384 domain-containing protein [Candidatus Hydrogenedentota bacterium]